MGGNDYLGYDYQLYHNISAPEDEEPEVQVVAKRIFKAERRLSDASTSFIPSDAESSSSASGTLESYDGDVGDEEWMQLYQPQYAFNDPRIRSRLERLMGSNVVRIMDRKYMTKLQERIKDDHLENLMKRIQKREAEEVEREKKLILEGKIPIEEAPKELKDHPVCKINQITKKIIEEKKSKTKNQSKISTYKTIVRKSKNIRKKSRADAISIRTNAENGEEEDENQLEQTDTDSAGANNLTEQDQDEKIDFGKDEYDKLKYEDPLVKVMKEAGNVEEMYKLAERILGPLKHTKK